jgi:hypothetical protein
MMKDSRRVVIENYPVERLPDELRGGLDPSHRARITVEDASVGPSIKAARLRRYFGAAKHKNTSVEEAVERVRALRDEWDE